MGANVLAPACNCCTCRGKKCLISHPGHDCGMPGREGYEELRRMLADRREEITAQLKRDLDEAEK